MSPASLQDRDVRLVCDAAVQLACCGVATALQSVVEQAGHHAAAAAAAAAHAPPHRLLHDEAPCDADEFRRSVHRLLRHESANAAPLDARACARLCVLLDMPSTVGWQWQVRRVTRRGSTGQQPSSCRLAPRSPGSRVL